VPVNENVSGAFAAFLSAITPLMLAFPDWRISFGMAPEEPDNCGNEFPPRYLRVSFTTEFKGVVFMVEKTVNLYVERDRVNHHEMAHEVLADVDRMFSDAIEDWLWINDKPRRADE
jgi:hypothetical protein